MNTYSSIYSRIFEKMVGDRILILNPLPDIAWERFSTGSFILVSSITESIVFSRERTIMGESMVLPFKDDTFNGVVVPGSFHFYDPFYLKNVLKELFRVLKSGGILVSLFKSREGATEAQTTNEALNRFLEKVGLMHFYEVSDVSLQMYDAGFELVSIEVIQDEIPLDPWIPIIHTYTMERYLKELKNEDLEKQYQEYINSLSKAGEAITPLIMVEAHKGDAAKD
jgi:SAM-dependent methyltransferase